MVFTIPPAKARAPTAHRGVHALYCGRVKRRTQNSERPPLRGMAVSGKRSPTNGRGRPRLLAETRNQNRNPFLIPTLSNARRWRRGAERVGHGFQCGVGAGVEGFAQRRKSRRFSVGEDIELSSRRGSRARPRSARGRAFGFVGGAPGRDRRRPPAIGSTVRVRLRGVREILSAGCRAPRQKSAHPGAFFEEQQVRLMQVGEALRDR